MARLKDILIYQSIYSELCKKLQADSRYVQKIMKNPFHNYWKTEVLYENTYTFEDFAKYVDFKQAENINTEFLTPLNHSEIKTTIKSIVNWTLKHLGNATESKSFEKKDIWGIQSRQNSLKTRTTVKQKT